MPLVFIRTPIRASVDVCFDLARDIDFHMKSMAGTHERAVGGVTSGLIALGQEVTWEARHFGILQRMTSCVTEFDPPHHFRDSMVSGPFRRFDHDHDFEQTGEVTVMTDRFDYESPFGIIGRLADAAFLRRYMARLLKRRAAALKAAAEARTRSGPKAETPQTIRPEN